VVAIPGLEAVLTVDRVVCLQHCDRGLWEKTLATDYWQAYIKAEKASASGTRRCLRERLMQLVLLHPSRSVKGLFHYFPLASGAATWEDLARCVFGELLD
jgi:hypothetical protein